MMDGVGFYFCGSCQIIYILQKQTPFKGGLAQSLCISKHNFFFFTKYTVAEKKSCN